VTGSPWLSTMSRDICLRCLATSQKRALGRIRTCNLLSRRSARPMHREYLTLANSGQ
jgi:hypothetical protein